MPSRVILYERAACHLCEEAASALDASIGPDRYERVDIEASNDLVARYGFRVPVVAVDGIDRLEAPMGADDIASLVRSLST